MPETKPALLEIKFAKRFSTDLFSNRVYFVLNIIIDLALVIQSGWLIFGSYYLSHISGSEFNITNIFFFSRLFYFALGIYVCNHYTRIKEQLLIKSLWTYVIPVIIFTCIDSYLWLRGIQVYGSFSAISSGTYCLYELLLQPLSYLFIFALLFIIITRIVSSGKPRKWLLLIGAYSFGMYLIHPFFLSCVSYGLYLIGITNITWIYYVILFVSVLICSMIFVWIMQKVPFHKYIIE